MDKAKSILLEALRQGASQSGEQRLYRSGKLPGLFPSRTTLNAEIAAQAIRDGFLELVRSETKGKTIIEWVRVTAQGTAHLVDHESPLHMLEELHQVLRQQQDGLPAWLAQLHARLDVEFQALSRRLESLGERVSEALQRAERIGPAVPAGSASVLPWSNAAVAYLEQRRTSGLEDRCPLPELFAALVKKEEQLTIRDFHSGLRRLHDRGVIRLFGHDGVSGPPEPEYALLDGATVYYYVAK